MLNLLGDKITRMPVLVLMPHSSCNCRCVMCDIWKANNNKKEISAEELEKHLESFQKLRVREVALSGGEALMHSNLWRFCELLKSINIKISLLSTGLLLSRHAENIIKYVDEVIVSLDGSHEIHNQIRKITSAYEKLGEGVKSLKKLKSQFPVKARCVIQKQNYIDLLNIIQSAKNIGLDQISFLAADVSTDAFNREEPWNQERQSSIALNKTDCELFQSLINDSFIKFRKEYQTRFIAESQKKMTEILQYYEGLLGLKSFPKRRCNAPWVSAVVEADGEVRPCFFHKSYGNIHNNNFKQLINSPQAIKFRKALDVSKNEICKKCVCSLKIPLVKIF